MIPRPVAFLFPGQGAEEPRMGLALAEGRVDARELLALAGDETGLPVEPLLARGGPALERTDVLQPILVAVALGSLRALRAAGVVPDLVAGHSLGELAAWCATGEIAEIDAVRLAAVRGRLMAAEAARAGGGMLALLDCEEAEAEAAVALGRTRGRMSLAARNAPREWALSGDDPALAAVLSRFPARRLSVSGAWHSEAMRGAVEPFRAAARALPRRPPACRLVSGTTGEAVEAPARIPELLAEQLVAPVLFTAALASLGRLGATDLVVVGPSRVLRGLVRKNLGPSVRVHAAETPEQVARAAEALAR